MHKLFKVFLKDDSLEIIFNNDKVSRVIKNKLFHKEVLEKFSSDYEKLIQKEDVIREQIHLNVIL